MSAITADSRAELRRLLDERERLLALRRDLPRGPMQSEACRGATQAFCQVSDAALKALPALLDDADALDAALARVAELETVCAMHEAWVREVERKKTAAADETGPGGGAMTDPALTESIEESETDETTHEAHQS